MLNKLRLILSRARIFVFVVCIGRHRTERKKKSERFKRKKIEPRKKRDLKNIIRKKYLNIKKIFIQIKKKSFLNTYAEITEEELDRHYIHICTCRLMMIIDSLFSLSLSQSGIFEFRVALINIVRLTKHIAAAALSLSFLFLYVVVPL